MNTKSRLSKVRGIYVGRPSNRFGAVPLTLRMPVRFIYNRHLLNDRARELFQHEGLMRGDLARELKCTPSHLAAVFTGKRRFDYDLLARLCKRLRLEITDVLTDSEVLTDPEPRVFFVTGTNL